MSKIYFMRSFVGVSDAENELCDNIKPIFVIGFMGKAIGIVVRRENDDNR
jgi:hypothetical protein